MSTMKNLIIKFDFHHCFFPNINFVKHMITWQIYKDTFQITEKIDSTLFKKAFFTMNGMVIWIP